MRKSESDRREDFDGVYDFETAFDPKFEMSLESEALEETVCRSILN